MRAALAIACVVLGTAAVADAYPQFQLSKDEQTCTGCHISPAGGLLLGENGLALAETMSTYGGAPEAAHGTLVGPGWLEVGGDARGAAGLVHVIGTKAAGFPMQGDVEAAAHGGGFTFLAMAGVQTGSSPQTFFASREHWLMWQPDQTATTGLYLRAGRFMPVFGLRFAEHTAYTRRYGQTPLYGETYGAAVEYIDPAWEVHATGFVHDPLQNAIERGDGGALYGEVRIAQAAALGLEGRYAKSSDDARSTGGVTAKYWLPQASVLLEGELQVTRQTFAAGSSRNQVVGYAVATWFVHPGWMLDLGGGSYDEDLHIQHVDLECLDANLHWFATSHWELLMTNRVQLTGLGSGGPTSGYALVQAHYRL